MQCIDTKEQEWDRYSESQRCIVVHKGIQDGDKRQP